MNLIVTEMAQIRIECSGSFGVGTIAQGTIPLSGPFMGSCVVTPTYVNNVTIDGFKVVSKLNFNLTGCLSGSTPTTNGMGSMQGSTIYDTDDNISFITSDQTVNITNGTCTTTTIPPTTIVFTGTASFINAGQSSSYGE